MINIKVLGTGCPNCQKLEDLCNEVVSENQIDAEIEKVTDINRFGEFGVFLTPSLVVNNNVLVQGKLPTKSTLTNWLQKLN